MVTEEAVCSLIFREKTVGFIDVGQVKNCIERLSKENLKHEENIFIIGGFQGILPKKRTFEFKIKVENEIISGKIAPNLKSPEKLNNILYKEITVKVTKTVVGQGKPRYLLIEFPEE